MRAFHRLVGDFPSRGYGNAVKTPGFPDDGPVINGTAPRLAAATAEGSRGNTGNASIVERTGTWELLQLDHNTPVVLRSALLAGVGRQHSYTDAIMADTTLNGSGVVPIRDMLLCSNFITPDTFWGLPKNTLTLPADEWVLADESELCNADAAGRPLYREPEGELLQRLLVRYWHAASMQTLGPWTDESRTQLTYSATRDPVMNGITKLPSTVTGILGSYEHHTDLIRAAKAFLYGTLLRHLPREVEGIATMSAGAAGKSLNIFHHSALLLMNADDQQQVNVNFDLNTGMMPAASADELALIQLIMEKGIDAVPFLKEMRERCFTPEQQQESDKLAADWQVLVTLYRIQQETVNLKLMRLWYRLFQLLMDRHTARRGERCSELMYQVDLAILGKMDLRREAIQADDTLMSVFWRKLMFIPLEDKRHQGMSALNAACQTVENVKYFIPRLINASYSPNEVAERAALALRMTLQQLYADGSLDAIHMKLLMDPGKLEENTLTRCSALRDVMCEYVSSELSAYRAGKRPTFRDGATDYCVYLLPMVQYFARTEQEVSALLESVTDCRVEQLFTPAECEFLNSFLERTHTPEACEATLCRYLCKAYAAQGDESLRDVLVMAYKLQVDPTEAAAALLEGERRRLSDIRLRFIDKLSKRGAEERRPRVYAAWRTYARNVLFADPATLISDLEVGAIYNGCAADAADVDAAAAAWYDGAIRHAPEMSGAVAAVAAKLKVGATTAVHLLLAGKRDRLTPEQLHAAWTIYQVERNAPRFAQDMAAYARNVLFAGDALLRIDECRIIANETAADPELRAALNEACTPYLLRCYARVGATAALGQMMAECRLDASPAAVALLDEARNALRKLSRDEQYMLLVTMGAHQGQQDSGAIGRAWKSYAMTVMASCAINDPADMQPWFEEGRTIYINAGNRDLEWTGDVLLGYITAWCTAQRRTPSPLAYDRLRALVTEESCRFDDRAPRMYETLLAQGYDEACAQQAAGLMKAFGSLEAYPQLHTLALKAMRTRMLEVWKTRDYWTGVDAAMLELPRSGVEMRELVVESVPLCVSQARQKAAVQVTQLNKPGHFAEEMDHTRKGAGLLADIWQEAIVGAFIASYEGMFLQVRTYEELSSLMRVQDYLAVSHSRIPNKAPLCAVHLMELRQRIVEQAKDEAPQASRAMALLQDSSAKLTSVGAFQSYHPVIHLLLQANFELIKPVRFHTQLVNACLVAIPQGKALPNWARVLSIVLPEWEDMLRKPFAPENLVLLHTISTMVQSLCSQYALREWAEDFVSFLCTDQRVRSYTSALRKKNASQYLSADVRDMLK